MKKAFSLILSIVFLINSAFVVLAKDKETTSTQESSVSISISGNALANVVVPATGADFGYVDEKGSYFGNRYIVKITDVSNSSIFSSMQNLKSFKQLSDKFFLIILNEPIKADDFIQSINDKFIEYVQPDFPLTADGLSEQWGINNNETISVTNTQDNKDDIDFKIDAKVSNAWKSAKGKDSLIGVIDSAIDINHSELKDKIYTNKKEKQDGQDDDKNGYIDDINGFNFVKNTNVIYSSDADKNEGHGTSIAGIISAIAPNSAIVPAVAFENGMGYTSNVISAIAYLNSKDVKIVNMSFSTANENKALKEVMSSTDMLFVCSAGNSKFNLSQKKVYPACFNLDNIIVVGSVNKKGELSNFSNYNPEVVDILAPGEDIATILPESNYANSSGTSFSAAFVSGAAALILTNNKKNTVKELKNDLIKGSDHILNLTSDVKDGNILNCENSVAKKDNKNNKIAIKRKKKNIEIQNITKSTIAPSDSVVQPTATPNVTTEPTAMPVENAEPTTTSGQAEQPIETPSQTTEPTGNESEQVSSFMLPQSMNMSMQEGDTTTPQPTETPSETATPEPSVSMPTLMSANSTTSLTNEVIQTLDKTITSNRADQTCVAYDNKVYIIGGREQNIAVNTVQVYDINSKEITTLPNSMPTARYKTKAVLVGNKIYVVGGYGSYGANRKIEVLDISSGNWTSLSDTPFSRTDFEITQIDNSLCVIGGRDENGLPTTKVSAMDLENPIWTNKVSLIKPVYNAEAININGNVYVIGGVDSASVQKYTTGTELIGSSYVTKNYWSYVDSLISPRSNFAIAGVTSGYSGYRIYLLGGMVDGKASNTVDIYCKGDVNDSDVEESYAWLRDKNLIAPSFTLSATAVNSNIYLFDGQSIYKRVAPTTPYIPADDSTELVPINLDEKVVGSINYRYFYPPDVNSDSDNFEFAVPTSGEYVIRFRESSNLRLLVNDNHSNLYSNSDSLSKEWSKIINLNAGEFYSFELSDIDNQGYGNYEFYITKNDLPSASTAFSKAKLVSYKNYNSDYIYALGGYGSSGMLDTIKKYDKSTNSWGVVNTTMSTKKTGFGAIVAYDQVDWHGNMYIIGGYTGTAYTNTVTAYNLDSFAMPTIPPPAEKAPMLTSRERASVVNVNDQYIYVIGGRNESGLTNKVERFNIASNSWESMSDLPVNIMDACSEFVGDHIYVTAGFADTEGYSTKVYDYSIATNTWTQKADMPIKLEQTNSKLVGNKIYVWGKEPGAGDSGDYAVYKYSTLSNTWEKDAMVFPNDFVYSSSIIVDNYMDTLEPYIYFVGGYSNTTGYSNIVKKYLHGFTAQSSQWETMPEMTTNTIDFQTVTVGNKLYVLGGRNKSISKGMFVYDSSLSSWTSIDKELPAALSGFGATAIDGKIYIAGGYNNGFQNTVYVYDPANNTWDQKASMNVCRDKVSLVAVNGKLYAMGGRNDEGILNTVEEYDPSENTWTVKNGTLASRIGAVAASYGNNIYIIGGNSFGNENVQTIEMYDTATYSSTVKSNIDVNIGVIKGVAANDGVYVASQYGGVYFYNPTENTFYVKEELTLDTANNPYFAIAGINNGIYAIGGYVGGVSKRVLHQKVSDSFNIPLIPTDNDAYFSDTVKCTEGIVTVSGVAPLDKNIVIRICNPDNNIETITNIKTGTDGTYSYNYPLKAPVSGGTYQVYISKSNDTSFISIPFVNNQQSGIHCIRMGNFSISNIKPRILVNFKTMDLNGNNLSTNELQPNSNISANFTIDNSTYTNTSQATAFIGLYNNLDQLISYSANSFMLNSDRVQFISTDSLLMPEYVLGYKIKAFICDGSNINSSSMTPLTGAFTFPNNTNVSFSDATKEINLTSKKDETFNVTVNVNNVTSFDNTKYTLTYDSAIFEPLDLCALTSDIETQTGQIPDANIEVLENYNGKIVFKVINQEIPPRKIPSGKYYSGCINVISFKCTSDMQSKINISASPINSN